MAVLAACWSSPQPVRALAEQFESSKETMYRYIRPGVERSFLESTADGYLLTGAGRVFVTAYEQCRAELGDERFQWLSREEIRSTLLHELGELPRERPAIAADFGISSATAYRIVRAAETFGWVVREHGTGYRRTMAGTHALETLTTFQHACEQCSAKAPFLNRLDLGAYGFPTHRLTMTELVTATAESPLAVANTNLPLALATATAPTTVRGLCRSYSPLLFEAIHARLHPETTVRITFTEPAYTELQTCSQREFIAGLDTRPGSEYRITDAPLPFSLMLYDRTALIVARTGGDDTGAGLVSTDPEVYDWAIQLFAHYWQASTRAEKRHASGSISVPDTLTNSSTARGSVEYERPVPPTES